jgi:hypothetical protein
MATLYKIVHKPSPLSLEEAVQAYLDKGWRPVGGVSYGHTTVHEGSAVWAQAVVMELPERDAGLGGP